MASGSDFLNVTTPQRIIIVRVVLLCMVLFLAIPSSVHAQEFVELTPELDARAAHLYKGIMCPICNGQSISQSNATVAETMRQMVRERLVAGDTDQQIYDFMTDAFGRDILSSPPTRGIGLAVWLVPPIVLILGSFAVALFVRRLRASNHIALADGSPDTNRGTSIELEPYLRLVDLEMEDQR